MYFISEAYTAYGLKWTGSQFFKGGGLTAIHYTLLCVMVFRKDCEGDWVTFGVLYYKAPPKQSSNGNDFSIWKLTDLKVSCASINCSQGCYKWGGGPMWAV